MAKESFQLDPNAVVYSDDEIVGKVNSATANISREGSVEAAARPIEENEVGATELEDEAYTSTEKTKLTGIDEGAKDDQTGMEVRDAILGLADVDRKLIITDPQTGEKPILALQRQADGKLDIDNDDQPIP